MIREYNSRTWLFGLPGLGLEMFGYFTSNTLLWLIGTALFLVCCAYYSKSKGRSAAWCVLGFLGLIGLIALYFLKDKAPEAQANAATV